MADRVLPSRESVGIDLALAAADLRHPDAPLFDILIIATEWANGRLVDREDIDYEAIATELTLYYEEDHLRLMSKVNREHRIEWARKAVDAAIGE